MSAFIVIEPSDLREIIREEFANGIQEYAVRQQLEKRINSQELYEHFGVSNPTGIKLKNYLMKIGQLNPVLSENGRQYFLLSDVININPKQILRKLRRSN